MTVADDLLLAILQKLDLSLCFVDRDARIQFANAAFARQLGLDAATLSNSELMPPLGQILDAYKTGAPLEHQDLMQHSDGEYFPFRLRIHALGDGQLLELQDLTQETTQRSVMDRALQIIELNPNFVATFDLEGNIQTLNRAGRQLLGFGDNEDLSERSLRSMIPADQIDRFFNEAVPTAFMHQIWSGESQLISADGQILDVLQLVMKHDADEHGQQYFSMFMIDLSERVQAEKEMRRAKDLAEAAARSKSAFLATMSHEIRTPMNGVLGMTQLLEETELDDEQRAYVETIMRSSKALLTIINDILDFSKGESGKMKLEPVEFDLEHACYEVCNLMMPRALEKDLELVLNYDPELPRRYLGDAGRIRQILLNLLGNAIKFTEAGYVVVQIGAAAKQEGKRLRLRISVTDTGIGIDQTQQMTLFEPFTQADDSTTRRFGGTGLGLSICRQLIELMQGEIGMQSQLQKGSTFWFEISLPALQVEKSMQGLRLANRRILVVDSYSIHLHVLRRQLLALGMQVMIVNDAKQALAELHQASQGPAAFEIAIIDSRIPFPSALEILHAIKRDPNIQDLPVLLFSSLSERHEAIRLQEAGFHGLLNKPVVSDVLQKTLQQVLDEFHHVPGFVNSSEVKTEPETGMNEPWQALQNQQILVVDDNPVNQRLLATILRKHGMQVQLAEDGAQALRLCKQQSYDAVLMDCIMPIMNGVESSRQIQSWRRSQQKPPQLILAVTADHSDSARKECLAAGMKDVILKPIDHHTLGQTLNNWLNSNSKNSESEAETQVEESSVEAVILDIEILRELEESMGEDFAELLEAFIDSSQDILKQLKAAFSAQQSEVISRQAHSIKSSSASLGFLRLSEAARRVELKYKAATESIDASDYDELKAAFIAGLEATRQQGLLLELDIKTLEL